MKFAKISRIFLVVLVLLISSSLAQDSNLWDPENPQNFDYSTADEANKQKYLQDVFGVTIPGGTAGAAIAGDQLTITNSAFTLNGVNFNGGTVKIGKDKNIISAQSAEVTNNLAFKGSTILGIFSFSGDTLTIEKGNLELGSNANADLPEVKAQKGTNVDVSAGQGYTGTITAVDGPFNVGAKDKQVSVGGSVEVENGKIKDGDKIDAITPVKGLFAGIPEDLEVSMVQGTVKGNKIESARYCLSADCFSSEKASSTEISEDGKLTIKGEKVRYRHDGKLERIINSKNGAVLEEPGKWKLSAGSSSTEVKASGASSTITVSKDTTYLPRSEKSSCDDIAGSCVAIDSFNSLRVKAEDDNKIKINNYAIMPAVTVDMIDDSSKVEYVEHNLAGAKKDKIKLTFSKRPLQVYPAANLGKMEARVVTQYTGSDGRVKTAVADSLQKKVEIIDQDSGDKKIVAHFDNWVAGNYYATSFGDVIPEADRKKYDRLIVNKIAADDKVSRDMFYVLFRNDPSLDPDAVLVGSDVNALTTVIREAQSSLPPNVDKASFIRRHLNQIESGTAGDLFNIISSTEKELAEAKETFSQLSAISKNQLLQGEILDLVEEGKLSKSAAVGFTKEFFGRIGAGKQYAPEDAHTYLNILTKVPENTEGIGLESRFLNRLIFNEFDALTELYKNNYAGDKQKGNSELFEHASIILDGQEVMIDERDFNLPAQVKQGELTKFVNAWTNMKRTRMLGLDDNLKPHNMETALTIWENDPELADALSRWHPDEKKSGITSAQLTSQIGLSKSNAKLDANYREQLAQTFHGRSIFLGAEVNRLGHEKKETERRQLVESLPANVQLEILNANIEHLGENHGLYASSYGLIFPSLMRKIGEGDEKRGKEEFISFMEKQGYPVGSKDGNNIMLILAASGSLKEVIPKGASKTAKREEIYRGMTTALVDQNPAIAGSTIDELINDPDVKKEFADSLLKNYENTNQKVKEGKASEDEAVRMDVMQFLIRSKKQEFETLVGKSNPQLQDIINNPSENVKDVEARLEIPTGKWVDKAIANGDVDSRGIPYLNAGAYFTDATPNDQNEEISYRGLAKSLPGFSVTKREKDEYVMEKPAKVLVKNDDGTVKQQDVVFRVFVTKDPENFCKDNECFVAATRGHSYSTENALDALDKNVKETPAMVHIGGCFGSVEAEKYIQKHPSAALTATGGTGKAHINNIALARSLDGLSKCTNYNCLSNQVDTAPGFKTDPKGRDTKYNSFRSYFVAGLKPQNS